MFISRRSREASKMRKISLVVGICLLALVHAESRPALTRLRGGAKPALPVVSAPRSGLVASSPPATKALRGGGAAGGLDIPLLLTFAGWYLGNYYYTINNKFALNAAKQFPMTVAFAQFLLGSLYALYLWLAPDARERPNISASDVAKIAPVAACAAGAHCASIFSMNLGAVSFAQIVKAAEPAFAALLGVTLYGKTLSMNKWLCLIPVIGGVCLASVKELDFSVAALLSACIANLFAAFRSNENKKLMDTPGLKDRIGSTGNQFALSILLGTLCILPVWAWREGGRLGPSAATFS